MNVNLHKIFENPCKKAEYLCIIMSNPYMKTEDFYMILSNPCMKTEDCYMILSNPCKMADDLYIFTSNPCKKADDFYIIWKGARLENTTPIVNIIRKTENGRNNIGDENMNMRKLSIWIMLFISLYLGGYAKKISVLPEIMNPVMITMSNNRLYVSQEYSIFIYSLPDCKLVKQFGSKGEGPGQFATRLFVYSVAGKIFVCDPYKMVTYSSNGDIIKERSFSNHYSRCIPLGENLIVSTLQPYENKLMRIDSLILDNNLEKVGKLHSGKPFAFSQEKKKCLITPLTSFWCNREYVILLDGEKGFHIEIFDKTGKKIRTIKKKLKMQSTTELHKQNHLEYRMAFSRGFVRNWERNKHRYFFPQFLPEVQDVFPTDENIYVKTYVLKEKKEEYLILDMKGNMKGATYLPIARKGLYSFSGDTFYYLKENHDSEEWNLFAEKINPIKK